MNVHPYLGLKVMAPSLIELLSLVCRARWVLNLLINYWILRFRLWQCHLTEIQQKWNLLTSTLSEVLRAVPGHQFYDCTHVHKLILHFFYLVSLLFYGRHYVKICMQFGCISGYLGNVFMPFNQKVSRTWWRWDFMLKGVPHSFSIIFMLTLRTRGHQPSRHLSGKSLSFWIRSLHGLFQEVWSCREQGRGRYGLLQEQKLSIEGTWHILCVLTSVWESLGSPSADYLVASMYVPQRVVFLFKSSLAPRMSTLPIRGSILSLSVWA